ncbi:MAG: glutamate--tRNA ligase family protein [Lentisphaerales bacterium]|nr:glutamate--tRNA ligase family protein [Lentisphaerales bacterium]
MSKAKYRGRIAPTPTGFLHLGHATTFSIAFKRAKAANGTILFRNEDLDPHRCKPEFIQACIDDLRACGLSWDEGPDIGGAFAPYNQSQKLEWFLEIWQSLKETGLIYPCDKSRKDVQEALTAPHNDDSEAIFPNELRPNNINLNDFSEPGKTNWRFKVPDREIISFVDNHFGKQCYTAGIDFGDFLIWRKDGFPSYELAVVADDHAMQITEVVRGKDLLLSTARQILIYRALGWDIPEFYHCDLILDENGERLAKRNKALSLRELISSGEINKYFQLIPPK